MIKTEIQIESTLVTKYFQSKKTKKNSGSNTKFNFYDIYYHIFFILLTCDNLDSSLQ